MRQVAEGLRAEAPILKKYSDGAPRNGQFPADGYNGHLISGERRVHGKASVRLTEPLASEKGHSIRLSVRSISIRSGRPRGVLFFKLTLEWVVDCLKLPRRQPGMEPGSEIRQLARTTWLKHGARARGIARARIGFTRSIACWLRVDTVNGDLSVLCDNAPLEYNGVQAKPWLGRNKSFPVTMGRFSTIFVGPPCACQGSLHAIRKPSPLARRYAFSPPFPDLQIPMGFLDSILASNVRFPCRQYSTFHRSRNGTQAPTLSMD